MGVILYVTDYSFEYAKECEIALILLSHFLIFGVFLILTCFPMTNVIKIYKNQMNVYKKDQNRTSSMNDTKQISPYCCFCCISFKYLHKIALFNANLVQNNDASSNGLRMLGSSSKIHDYGGRDDSMTESDDALFTEYKDEMNEFGVGHTMTINAGEHNNNKNGKKIEFVQIKPAKKENINIDI